MSLPDLARIFLVGLVLMWLASIASEPGGLPAFAAEIGSVEEGLHTETVQLETAVRNDQHSWPEFLGLVCGRPLDAQGPDAEECTLPPPDPAFGF